jgi:hypothetical protein
MKDNWYTNYVDLYNELIFKIEGKPLNLKQKKSSSATKTTSSLSNEQMLRKPNIIVNKKNRTIIVKIKRALLLPKFGNITSGKRRRTKR